MKHLPLVLAVALFSGLTFSSCKKDYKCDCKLAFMGEDTTLSYDLGKLKKKDAKSKCDANASTWTTLTAGSGVTVDCSIEKK